LALLSAILHVEHITDCFATQLLLIDRFEPCPHIISPGRWCGGDLVLRVARVEDLPTSAGLTDLIPRPVHSRPCVD